MQTFTLALSNGAQVSGLLSLPPRTVTTPHHRPLIVGLHGGTYTSQYFAAGTANSAHKIAEVLGVPFISLDRPGYKASTALPPVPEDSTFLQEEGKYLHEQILPAIWEEYGSKSDASTLVILAHSLGSPAAIISAALHARQAAPTYPYGGLIMSGWGVELNVPKEGTGNMATDMAVDGRIQWPLESKDVTMLGPTPDRARNAPSDILGMTAELDHTMSVGEIEDGRNSWFGYWLDYAKDVTVPVMYGIGEHDALWKASEANTEDFARVFERSARVERGVVLEAPHCLELSFWGPGWIARCVGFGIECAAATKVAKQQRI